MQHWGEGVLCFREECMPHAVCISGAPQTWWRLMTIHDNALYKTILIYILIYIIYIYILYIYYYMVPIVEVSGSVWKCPVIPLWIAAFLLRCANLLAHEFWEAGDANPAIKCITQTTTAGEIHIASYRNMFPLFIVRCPFQRSCTFFPLSSLLVRWTMARWLHVHCWPGT